MEPSLKNSADLDFSIHLPHVSSKKEKIRQVFDDISLNVISFLEKHKGVTDVKFFERPGITDSQIKEWEKKYFPCKLPSDYKAFLQISDGFLLRWHMKYNNQVLPLGCMHLSSLKNVKPINLSHLKSSNATHDTFEHSEAQSSDTSTSKPDSGSVANQSSSYKNGSLSFPIAFNIDSTMTDGSIVLFYENADADPSIWFQDVSCEWNYVCDNFVCYFRLMIMHLGLPHWQYAFSNVGLNLITLQWLRFLVPERLDIDLKFASNMDNSGWLLPKHDRNLNVSQEKLHRKRKLNLNKIDQIVKSHINKMSNININDMQSQNPGKTGSKSKQMKNGKKLDTGIGDAKSKKGSLKQKRFSKESTKSYRSSTGRK